MRTRVLLVAILVCTALPTAADARPSVVVDADMSFDDAATLAYLAQADRHGVIDLDAVTVSLSGAGYTGRGLSHARCLLRKHELRGVPVSDGDALGANPLPEAIRSYVDRVVHDAAALGNSAACPDVPTEGRACCGAGDGTDHGQEFNFWADPAAAQRVFSSLSGKIHHTALDATDFVPITFDFLDRLSADDTTVATATVVTILSTPTCRSSCARASCTGGTRSTRPRRSPAVS